MGDLSDLLEISHADCFQSPLFLKSASACILDNLLYDRFGPTVYAFRLNGGVFRDRDRGWGTVNSGRGGKDDSVGSVFLHCLY